MNRDAVVNWLHQFNSLENDFKEYYDQHKAPITDEYFFEILKRNQGIGRTLKNDFRNIDPSSAYIGTDEISRREQTDFSEGLWIYQNEAVSIRKHPRYFPVLVHTHEFVELAYVYQGSCSQTFIFSDERMETVSMSNGTLCIIPPHLAHSISVFDDSIVINILIRTSTMKQTLSSLVAGSHGLFEFFLHTLHDDSAPNFLLFETKEDESLRSLILDMMLEACEAKPYSQKAVFLLLGLFFTYLQRDYTETVRFSVASTNGLRYIPQILEYMHKNYATTGVEEIASHFFISKSYLSRIFKMHTNLSVIQMLQQIRMQHAREYLEHSRISVQQVGEMIGYSDVTFFIRIFRKYSGLTPLQYRYLNKNEHSDERL